MLSSLLRPSRRTSKPEGRERASFLSPYAASGTARRDRVNHGRHVGEAFEHSEASADEEAEDEDEDEEDEQRDGDEEEEEEEDDEGEDADESEDDESDEDGMGESTPLLPIFSAVLLDAIPVYNLTHTVRLLVVGRCETTLSWDQLRSPQVSQFMLKPIQQEIRASHFSAATQYVLMANCLQFHKEASLNPGHSGTSKTRAMVCELLAIKLLKEYNTRELIDALSYDFDPLQGQIPTFPGQPTRIETAPKPNWDTTRKPRSARISCLEIAIRAQAKRFLAHPMVVQHLEAIWAGSIVFHSAADSMHRRPVKIATNHNRGYGTAGRSPRGHAQVETNASDLQHAKQREYPQDVEVTARRAVTLYNPKDASLFKLSRLRVPRYRNLLSTGSFAVLLGLFLAVLIQRSLEITTLEVFFWFWTAGYMLDEIIGFNEQGFSLYIASFWNTFDLGILLILFVHLSLRIYGIVLVDVGKHKIANMAYDVLAADAILLFPRLFSVLDHYRYFSQLLIAFRMMATDLMAIFVLILISCSGFFVALTLSFGNEGIDTPGSVAYALLQILMGYTPAAWDRWNGYNALGKSILTLFLFICHFLVVTILITVLTNSFMAIVQNANEEHQFVFAVNTISMIKSDALFSYVAPTNILAWVLTPLRYIVPFRQYVKINRTMIKVTHFPILFLVCFYEKTILQSSVVDAIDVVQPRGRLQSQFSPKLPRRNREHSVATFRQDRALEEVFRQPFDSTMRKSQQSQERRKTSNVVSSWMKTVDEDVLSPPQEQDRSIVDRLENRRSSRRRSRMLSRARNFTHGTRSVVSDPEEFVGHDLLSPSPLLLSAKATTPSNVDGPSQQTDVDGDDERLPNENDDEDKATLGPRSSVAENDFQTGPGNLRAADYFSHRITSRVKASETNPLSSSHHARVHPIPAGDQSPDQASPLRLTSKRRPNQHLRNVSTATIVYKPVHDSAKDHASSQDHPASRPLSASPRKGQLTAPGSGTHTPSSKPVSSAAGRRQHKRATQGPTRMRPVMPSKDNPAFRSAPDLAGLVMPQDRSQEDTGRGPSLDLELVSDIGDNKAIGGGYVGAIPASFATQMAYAAGGLRRKERNEEQDMMSRIMMARMNSLEEGFREVVHEMRDHLRRNESRSRSRSRSRERARDRDGRHLHPPARKGKEKPGTSNKENQEDKHPTEKGQVRRPEARPDFAQVSSLGMDPPKVTEIAEERVDDESCA